MNMVCALHGNKVEAYKKKSALASSWKECFIASIHCIKNIRSIENVFVRANSSRKNRDFGYRKESVGLENIGYKRKQLSVQFCQLFYELNHSVCNTDSSKLLNKSQKATSSGNV